VGFGDLLHYGRPFIIVLTATGKQAAFGNNHYSQSH
jgi:hypothetical protein